MKVQRARSISVPSQASRLSISDPMPMSSPTSSPVTIPDQDSNTNQRYLPTPGPPVPTSSHPLNSVQPSTPAVSHYGQPPEYACPSCKQPFKRSSSADSKIPDTVPEEVSRGAHSCPSIEEQLGKLKLQVKEIAKENRELKLEIMKIYNILCQKGVGLDSDTTRDYDKTSMRRIRKIDIGQPTNFQHTSHLGSNDVSTKIDTLEVSMKNKGGYVPGETNYSTEPAMPTRPIRREE